MFITLFITFLWIIQLPFLILRVRRHVSLLSIVYLIWRILRQLENKINCTLIGTYLSQCRDVTAHILCIVQERNIIFSLYILF